MPPRTEYRITIEASERVLAERARIADDLISRFFGLMGRRALPSGTALILEHCSMVHMFFMRFPLDIVFCSEDNVVIDFHEDLRPWRVSKCVLDAAKIVELPAGQIRQTELARGQKLLIRTVSADNC